MIDQELLDILVCPETKEPVSIGSKELIEKINEKINENTLLNRGNRVVTQTIDGGLIRNDQKFLYPIRENIPIMLIEEAIPLEGLT
jgi:uncharacterized protein YbaR (Trm112 family)